MSKLMKGCLITALGCAVLGAVVLACAVSAGGIEQIRQMAENGELSFDPDHIHWEWSFGPGEGDYDIPVVSEGKTLKWELTEQETAQIEQLEIDIKGGALTVVSTDEDIIRAECSGSHPVKFSVEDDVLKLQDKGHENWRPFEKREILLYLPAGTDLKKVVCDVGGGMVDMDARTADQAEIDLGAGQLVIDHMICKKAEGTIGAGSMKIGDADIEEAAFDVGAGEIRYAGRIGKRLEAECSMGQADFELEKREEDYNYSIDVSMGEIQIGQESYEGLDSQRNVDNGAAREIELDCSMGRIRVTFEE